MKNWIITALISGIIGGVLTYIITRDTLTCSIATILVFIIIVLNNPKTRYLKAFYIVIFPLLSTIYFTIESKTDNFNIVAGLKQLDKITVLTLGIIAIVCLILDYLERNDKLKGRGAFISKKSNTIGDIKGDNNKVMQNND